jgi:hypothetical protein
MEMAGIMDPESETVTAVQRIQRHDGEVSEREVGELALHPLHKHWHLQDFATFELWSFKPGGELDQLLATTGKITFCLLDHVRASPPPANVAPDPEFIECRWQVQGISEGWSETYTADLPGQELDITPIPDGPYAIRTTLDPENRLQELNEVNNTVTSYLELREGRVEVLGAP